MYCIFWRFVFVCFFCGFFSILNAQPWVMFNDLDDTYLYDQATGQVYIRVKKGGKNYEDTFVKMGVQDSIGVRGKDFAQKKQNSTSQNTSSSAEEQKKLLEKAQELQRSIQGSILGSN